MSNFRTEPPLVSVYCMTYNQENTIAQTIESIMQQKTSFPFELIIHDDASTDHTAEIVRKYADKFSEIRPVFQEKNQFRNCNLIKTFIHPVARGKLIAICEGDDYWIDENKLQIQADYMIEHPECMLTFHAVKQLDSDGNVMTVRPMKTSGLASADLIIKRGGMFCPSVSSMFRKEVMDCWPSFRDEADVYDYPAQALAASMGTIYYIDRIMGVYRFASSGSWTEQHKDKVDYTHIENETGWLKKFDEYTHNKYSCAIHYHMAHLWFTEFRKSFDPAVRKKAWHYTKKLGLKDRLTFQILILLFSCLGRGGNKLWEVLKRFLLK